MPAPSEVGPEKLRQARPLLIVNELSGATTGTGRVYSAIEECLVRRGVPFIELNSQADPNFHSVPIRLYPEVSRVTNPVSGTFSFIEKVRPSAIHVGTVESPLGLATLAYCNVMKIPYTASYRIKLADYISIYLQKMTEDKIQAPPETFHSLIRLFYQNASRVFVPNGSIANELHQMGIQNTLEWPRGVDTNVFRSPAPNEANVYHQYEWHRPEKSIILYAGRIAVEKNIEAALRGNIDTNRYQLVVIGPGPSDYVKKLHDLYGDKVEFLGEMNKEQLAAHFRFAHSLVFPSLTDTHGNVMTEAIASGTPVIAYADTSTSELIQQKVNGILVDQQADLLSAVPDAVKIDRNKCKKTVENRTWERSTDILLQHIVPIKEQWGTNMSHYAATRIIGSLPI